MANKNYQAKHCIRCDVELPKKQGVQKFCVKCGHTINTLRSYGIVGSWTLEKEKKAELKFRGNKNEWL